MCIPLPWVCTPSSFVWPPYAKKLFQNQKRLKKLDTKHVPLAQNFELKKGVKGVKK